MLKLYGTSIKYSDHANYICLTGIPYSHEELQDSADTDEFRPRSANDGQGPVVEPPRWRPDVNTISYSVYVLM